MARTALPLVAGSDVGTSPVGVSPSPDGAIIPPDSVLFVRNGTGGNLTVTVHVPATESTPAGLEPPDRILTIPTGGRWGHIGPFNPAVYGQPSGPDKGMVYVDFSSVSLARAFAVSVRR